MGPAYYCMPIRYPQSHQLSPFGRRCAANPLTALRCATQPSRELLSLLFWCHHVANFWTLVLSQQHKPENLPAGKAVGAEKGTLPPLPGEAAGPRRHLYRGRPLSWLKARCHCWDQKVVEPSPARPGSHRIIKHAQTQYTSGHAELHSRNAATQLFRLLTQAPASFHPHLAC